MDTESWTLVTASIIDRGGVPLALVVGTGRIAADGQDPTAFVAWCAAAAVVGDMACFWMGRSVSRRALADTRSPFDRSPASLASQLRRVAQFVEAAPRTWLVAGRVFGAVNQFVPMACGALGRPVIECMVYSAIGAAAWATTWGLLAISWGGVLADSGMATRVATAVLGIAVCAWSLKVARRRTAASDQVRR